MCDAIATIDLSLESVLATTPDNGVGGLDTPIKLASLSNDGGLIGQAASWGE